MHTVRTLFLLVPLALAACASTGAPAAADSPWGGLDPHSSHHLDEGGSITVSEDGVVTARVTVEDGRLLLDDRDLGPYTREQPIHFLADGRLTVAGETRGRIGAR